MFRWVGLWKRYRELREAIRESKNIRTNKEHIDELYIIDGKANIHVSVGKLYNPLSMGNLRQLDGQIFDYIEESANLLPPKVPIRVILHGVPRNERKGIPALFTMHYHFVAQDKLWDQRSNRNKMLFMTIIGLLFISAYLFLGTQQGDDLLLEILNIIGWVCLWEAAECFLVERREIKRALLETAQFLTMEIAFEE